MTWEYVGGDGLWQNHKNSETGEQTIKTHTPKLIKKWCPDGEHIYSGEVPTNRIITCLKCGQEAKFVVGLHVFKAGRLLSRSS
jgi:hypothetical protein